MNILAIDCAVSRLNIALKYEDKLIAQTLDIGMRQSEMLVPTIDEILNKMGIKASELNATALTIGPGSFTGLRLGISALKAIELAFGTPLYGISSLQAYAYPLLNFGLPVLSCIDANKDKFYASITGSDMQELLKEDDWEVEKIAEAVKGLEKVIISGPDAEKLSDLLKENCPSTQFITVRTHFETAEALIEITEKLIEEKKEPLKDYDGPLYLRASEAEIKLNAEK